MSRLNKERQLELEPKRMQYAMNVLTKMGFKPEVIGDTKIQFEFKGSPVSLYPYSGWHTGKTITDGRGIELLLKQLKPNTQ